MIEEKNTIELRTKSIGKLLLQYAIPSVVSMLVIALYNIVDRVFIGHSLGAMAISGLAITLPISAMITAVGTLVGIGASSRISIVLGKKDIDWARNILCHFPILTIGISFVFIFFSMLYLEDLLFLFGATENTIEYAEKYLKIIIPSSVLTNLCFGFSNILRASGFPHKSMKAVLIGVVLNIILDPIFLFVFKMGIEGVAIATAISMGIGALYSIVHFLNRSNLISFHWESFKIKKKIIINILSIGFSPFMMNIAASLVVMLVNIQLSKHGGDMAIGAFGILYSYQLVLSLILMGVANAMQPITGYNFGAGNYKRVKDVVFLTARATTIITIPFFVAAQLIPDILAKLFTTDKELIEYSVTGFRFSFLGTLFLGMPFTVSILFLSVGKAVKSTVMSLLRQIIVLVPLLIILPMFFGTKGVWYAMSASDVIAFFIATIFLFKELKSIYLKNNKNVTFLNIIRWKSK